MECIKHATSHPDSLFIVQLQVCVLQSWEIWQIYFPLDSWGEKKSIVVLQIVDTVLLSLFMVGRNIYIHVASMRIESSANHFTFLIVGNISKRLVMVLYISNFVSFPIFLFFQCWLCSDLKPCSFLSWYQGS